MDPLAIRVKLKIPTNPPSYCFLPVGSSSLAALRYDVKQIITAHLPSDNLEWHLQVIREEEGVSKRYIVTTNEDVMRLMTQDILVLSWEIPPSTVTHLHQAPLKLDVDTSSSTSDLAVRLTACTNPASTNDRRMDAMRVWDADEFLTASAEECAVLCNTLQSNGFIFVRISEEDLAIQLAIMDPLAIRVKLKIPTNPPSYCFLPVGSSSLAALRYDVKQIITAHLPSDNLEWHLQVIREEEGVSKRYIVTTNEDVMRLMTQDILVLSWEIPPSTVTHLHQAPLKLDVDTSSSTSDLAVRLTACTNPASTNDRRMDAMRVWDADEFLTASAEECAVLCNTLQSNGFIFVRISEEDLAIHRRSRQALAQFWKLPVEEKNKYYIGDSSRRWGYRQLAYLNKEYFKIRKTNGMVWPSDGTLKQLAMAEYEMFNSVLKNLLHGIGRHIGFERELEDMLHYPANLPLSAENATSFGEAFLYGANETDQFVEPCPMHADMGLLTIIPPGDGPPALELFSWQHGWQNVEASNTMTTDSRVCVVFPGDLLGAVTNDFFQATPHRVVMPPRSGPRESIIFEILPRPDYVIDCSKLSFNVAGEAKSTPQTSTQFLLSVSKGRPSVNADY
eukprot:TRINITY_DN1013_c0_g1_i1.p1 TRINITY_DN1013_c0_g1~~TRINITY_DN1013_c0_g1_i1.p1  ORF type:complete len:629 (+),score=62.62 TRINITY_DN1013_c0_g1_i1:34-1887(+)